MLTHLNPLESDYISPAKFSCESSSSASFVCELNDWGGRVTSVPLFPVYHLVRNPESSATF